MSNKPKHFLDTSIFYEQLKLEPSEFEEKINMFADGRKYAAYYTAIELNRGFLKAMVEHHQTVLRLRNVRSAINILSNEYGRIPSYGNILIGYMLTFSGNVSSDYRIYAGELEGIIMEMVDRTNSLVKNFVGHFQDHVLASLSLYSQNDYEKFLKTCNSSSTVEMEEFWIDYAIQIDKVIAKLFDKAPKLKKKELELFNFLESVLSGSLASKYDHVPDLAISFECPRNYKMVAHDRMFDLFIPLQEKTGGFVSF